MNIANKSSSEKTIINIQKIEQVIVMWRKIKYLTKLRENKSKNNRHSNRHIREMDRHQVGKKLQFKTIDDPILIDHLFAERNANHLNQTDGTPFTVEPLLSLIGKDTFMTFSQELLDDTADLSKRQLSPTI